MDTMLDEVAIIIPNIVLQDQAAVEQYAQYFRALSEYSQTQGPGVSKFAMLQPKDEPSSTEIFALENFQSPVALKKHRASEEFRDMFSWLVNSQPNGPHPLPTPVSLQLIFSFSRPAISWSTQPFVTVTQARMIDEDAPVVNAELRGICKRMVNDEGVYMVLAGKSNGLIWTISAHCHESRFRGGAFAAFVEREGWSSRKMQIVSGFLVK